MSTIGTSPGATKSASKTGWSRRLGRPIRFVLEATAPVRPRIVAARRASWTTATTGCHSRRLKTWTPWSRFSRTLCRRTSREDRARPGDALASGGCRGTGQGSRGSPGSAVFAARRQRPNSRRRAPHPYAPAVMRRSARRCASKLAASIAASSPCCCRMLLTSAWAAGSVRRSNLRCNVAAVVSA